MNIYNIRQYGASGDGKTKDTQAIQKAIDQCAKDGGGVVYCAQGTYLSGSLCLRSHVTLHLSAGATILGSTDQEDWKEFDPDDNIPKEYFPYNTRYLIFARNEGNIAITGSGTIDGQGDYYLGPMESEQPGPYTHFSVGKDWRPGRMIMFLGCRDVTVENVNIVKSPAWAFHILGCDTVKIRGITIINNYLAINTDGIDVDCSRNVSISDSHILAGDDCIVLRSIARLLRNPSPCENVTVTNCTLITSCNGIRIGYYGDEVIRSCVFSNLVISNTNIGITALVGDLPERGIRHAPTIENISFSNIIMETNKAIRLIIDKRAEISGGCMRNISFSQMHISSVCNSTISGCDALPIEGVRFNNIKYTVRAFEGRKPSSDYPQTHGFYCNNACNIIFRDVEVEWEDIQDACCSALVCEEITGLELDHIIARLTDGAANAPVITLSDVHNCFVHGCRAGKSTSIFLRLTGDRTSDISAIGNDLHGVEKPFDLDETVSENAFFQTANRVSE